MRRTIIGLVTVALIIGGPIAHAQDGGVLADADVAHIRARCVSVQTTLNRVQESDTLARVNLAQQYETLSTKLMAPLNSRVALNRLDGVALTKTTVDFDKQLDNFRVLYQQYKETLSRAIDLKCTDQPVAFYDALTTAREHRAAVRESVVEMTRLIGQYSEQVDALRASVKKDAT
jgi:hypothetical protein